ncbi:MAG: hypothetical protein NT082_08195, partial [Chloroflexi bacterium]|nr:hypothetical protein [Chloroflexota bacterium]
RSWKSSRNVNSERASYAAAGEEKYVRRPPDLVASAFITINANRLSPRRTLWGPSAQKYNGGSDLPS